MDSITLHSPAETVAYASGIATKLGGGEVLALTGDLGAGKTHFTKGLAQGLGCDPAGVTSPTFTLVHEYTGGRLPLFHFDFYRLQSADEALGLGLDEYLESGGVCVIEWGDKFATLLPAETRWYHLQNGEGEVRILTVRNGHS
jgi:tRNA threonylcarbamoyladenosine biosynthesis protein TsaE